MATDTSPDSRVVVVGAGPVGLFLVGKQPCREPFVEVEIVPVEFEQRQHLLHRAVAVLKRVMDLD